MKKEEQMDSVSDKQYSAELVKDWENTYNTNPSVVHRERPLTQANWHLSYDPSLKLLDLGCGTGDTTRPLKALTGGTVVGVDIAPDMLKFAQEFEDAHKQGIQYFVADCTKDLMQIPGVAALAPFDLVNASWTLGEVGTVEQLKGMIASAYGVLKKGGRFCGHINGANLTLSEYRMHERYGLFLRVNEDNEVLKEGQLMTWTIINNPKKKPLVVTNYFWSAPLIEKLAKEVGFTEAHFIPPPYPFQAENEYEAAFYKLSTDKPNFSMFSCTK